MLETKLGKLFSSYGYKKYKMSKFESYDLYAENRDFLKSSELITFNDRDGKLLALKPDITLSIIKGCEESGAKLYYNETVYRPKDNHFREIQQAGVECIGKIDVSSEAEVLAMAAASLKCISPDYVLSISDSLLLSAVFDDFEINGDDRERITALLTEKNSSGIRDLLQKKNYSENAVKSITKIAEIYLPLTKGISALQRLKGLKSARKTISHLKRVCDILLCYVDEEKIYLDFSTVNSMVYYNGIVFQGAVKGIPFNVLSGGRYDKLPLKMGKRCGAIGFAIYLDEIDNYFTKPKKYDADILLLYGAGADLKKAAVIARRYREKGKSVIMQSEKSESEPKCRNTVVVDKEKKK